MENPLQIKEEYLEPPGGNESSFGEILDEENGENGSHFMMIKQESSDYPGMDQEQNYEENNPDQGMYNNIRYVM